MHTYSSKDIGFRSIFLPVTLDGDISPILANLSDSSFWLFSCWFWRLLVSVICSFKSLVLISIIFKKFLLLKKRISIHFSLSYFSISNIMISFHVSFWYRFVYSENIIMQNKLITSYCFTLLRHHLLIYRQIIVCF